MEPWGTPGFTFFHVEIYSLRTTRCFLSFKTWRGLVNFLVWYFKLVWKWYHHTTAYSNAFEISRKTLLTLRPSSSKEPYISWVTDNSWLMQESLVLKPNWVKEMSLLSIKNWNNSLNNNLSRIFPKIGSSDTGR